MTINRMMVNNHLGKKLSLIPKNSANGLETQAASDPVIEKAINISISCKFDWISHRFFNFSNTSLLIKAFLRTFLKTRRNVDVYFKFHY